jgi:hypothetical protein
MKPGRFIRAAVAIVLLASAAQGYYHFVHFGSRVGPFRPIYEKFDLNALPNRTLQYFVSDPNGVRMNLADSFPSLVSQIRAAVGVWNGIETSDLRLAFGGFTGAGQPQQGPHVEFLFEEVTPGLIAMGGPTIRGDIRDGFVPILKSVVIVNPDLRNLLSYSEGLHGTLVHEFGHAIGLQHTFTSSVMSTAVTRSTSRAKPLTADDIAAVTILYPKPNAFASTGSISGRVTLNGTGVNLASVIAISPNGSAVGTLTNPDGTYQIDGLPPRTYYVYVHPIPPPRPGQATPGDIAYPVDGAGQPFPVGSPFETVFFPGAKDLGGAVAIGVDQGRTVPGVDFNVLGRATHGIHSIESYAFPGNTAVKPPYLSPNMQRPFVVATGSGLVANNGPVSGLTASVLGGASLALRPYSPSPAFYLELALDPQTLLVPSNTPRHLLFSANNDIYVLPSAFFHVERQPPFIASVTPFLEGTNRLAAITGVNLGTDTRILLDGAEATVREVDVAAGRLVVAVPAANAGHRAAVVALNSDGQSSMFVQADAVPFYTYDEPAAQAPLASITPSILWPGTEVLVQVDVANARLIERQIGAGFGNTDLTVKSVVASGPNRLLMNVAVSPAAQLGFANLSLIAGLQMIQQPFAVSVQAAPARIFWLSSNVVNAITGSTLLSPGNPTVIIATGAPVAPTQANTVVLIDEVRVPVAAVNGNQIGFIVPAGVPPGPHTLRLETTGERSQPVLLMVESVPPRIVAVSSTTVRTGELLSYIVADIGAGNEARVTIDIGGKQARIIQMAPNQGNHTILFQIPEDAPVGEVPSTVSVDGRTSDAIKLSISK